MHVTCNARMRLAIHACDWQCMRATGSACVRLAVHACDLQCMHTTLIAHVSAPLSHVNNEPMDHLQVIIKSLAGAHTTYL